MLTPTTMVQISGCTFQFAPAKRIWIHPSALPSWGMSCCRTSAGQLFCHFWSGSVHHSRSQLSILLSSKFELLQTCCKIWSDSGLIITRWTHLCILLSSKSELLQTCCKIWSGSGPIIAQEVIWACSPSLEMSCCRPFVTSMPQVIFYVGKSLKRTARLQNELLQMTKGRLYPSLPWENLAL